MEKLKERMDTLSDAIIAIAITILVLEIQVPKDMAELSQFTYEISLFALSFFVIFNYWYHRTITAVMVEKTNLQILSFDVLAHFTLCLIPLFTRLMFHFDHRGLAVFLYGSLLILTSAFFNLAEYYAIRFYLRNREITHKSPYYRNMKLRIISQILFGIPLIMLAYLFPDLVVYLYVIFPIAKFLHNFFENQHFINKNASLTELVELRYQKRENRKQGRHKNQS